MTNNFKDEYKPTNREKNKIAKKGKHWCIFCDSQLIGQYGKCPNCGKYANRKKLKGYYWKIIKPKKRIMSLQTALTVSEAIQLVVSSIDLSFINHIFNNGMDGKTLPYSEDRICDDILISNGNNPKIFTVSSTEQFNIYFEKDPSEIYLEYLNDSDLEKLDWIKNIELFKTFNKNCQLIIKKIMNEDYDKLISDVIKRLKLDDKLRTIKQPTLSDLGGFNENSFLYGFSVKDIKVDEIKRIDIVLSYGNDDGKILKTFKKE